MLHIIACLWHLLLYLEQKNILVDETNWLKENNLEQSSVDILYVQCYYWTILTVMLVGSPVNSIHEVIFAGITILLTVSVYAYIISTISMILNEINQDSQQFKRDLEIINRYIQIKKISKQTQQKIRGSIEYLYQDSKDIKNIVKAQDVLDKLPKYLREEISYEIFADYLYNFKFITNNFSLQTQFELKKFMRDKQFVTSEIIFSQDQIKDLSCYYIQKGEVEIYMSGYDSQKQYKIGTFGPGQFLGDYNFLSGLKYNYTVKTITFASLIQIKRSDFINIIQNNLQDYEKFCTISHELINNEYSRFYHRTCQICQLQPHIEENCNMLNYRPNYGTIFLKNQKSFPILNRNKTKRKLSKNDSINAVNGYIQDYLYNVHLVLTQEEYFLDYMSKLDRESQIWQTQDIDHDLDYENEFDSYEQDYQQDDKIQLQILKEKEQEEEEEIKKREFKTNLQQNTQSLNSNYLQQRQISNNLTEDLSIYEYLQQQNTNSLIKQV